MSEPFANCIDRAESKARFAFFLQGRCLSAPSGVRKGRPYNAAPIRG